MNRLLMAALVMTCPFYAGYAQEQAPAEEAQRRPAARQQRPSGFGTTDDAIRKDYAGPSIVEGQPAGVKAGEYPPDFQLEPVKLYPQLTEWLGSKAPARFEDKVMLSDLVGDKPVMLHFGSYT